MDKKCDKCGEEIDPVVISKDGQTRLPTCEDCLGHTFEENE